MEPLRDDRSLKTDRAAGALGGWLAGRRVVVVWGGGGARGGVFRAGHFVFFLDTPNLSCVE